MTRRRRWVVAALATIAFGILTAGGLAYLTTGSTNGSSGEADGGSVNTVTGLARGVGGVTPTANPNVPLAWNTTTLANGGAVGGYIVNRYNGSNVLQTTGANCNGTVAGTTCTENSVPDGTWKYGVQAKFHNWLGAESSQITVKVDTSAATITAKPANPSANASPSFSFSHATYSTFKCQLDGGGFTTCTSPKSYSSLSDGSHTFQVEATDANGVATQVAGYTWTVDTSAPTISASPSNPSANSSPSFSFSHTRVAYTFKCQLDGGGFSTCSSPKSYSSLSDGSHTFKVEAIDGDGIATQISTYTWTIDTSAPTITAKPSNPSANTAPTFTFSHSSYSTFVCQLDSSGSFTTGQCSPSSLTDANHTLDVKAKAADGSLTSAASYTWKVSTGAPTISTKPSNPSANPTPTFAFTHADYSSFVCQLDTSGTFTAGQCSPTSLSNASHKLDVKAKAADGSVTAAASYTWTVDATAPTITAKPSNPSATASPSFSFSHTQGVYTFECKLDVGAFASCSSPKSYSGLSDGSHTFQVHALDGNSFATAAASYTWVIDTTPPSVSVGTITKAGTLACEFINGSSVYFTTAGVATGNTCNAASGSFTVPVTATDTGGSGMQKVNYPAGTLANVTGSGDVLGAGPAFTTTYTWGSTSTGSASTITAYDNANNTNTAPFSIALDNTAPTGTITSPSAGTVTGTVSLASTTAADAGSGVNSVAYYRCTGNGAGCTGTTPLSTPANWTLIATGTSGPNWSNSWDSTTVLNGTFTLKAVISDNVGNLFATTGTGTAVTVNNPNKLVITSTAVSGAAMLGTSPTGGPNLGPITVQQQTANGTPVVGALTVTLSDGAGALFATSQFGATVTTVSIPGGQSSTTFWYGNTNTGTPTITASAAGLTSGTQQETITTAPAGLGMVITGGSGTPSKSCGAISTSYTCTVTGTGMGGNVVFDVTFVNSSGTQVVYSATQASTIAAAGGANPTPTSVVIAANATNSSPMTITASHSGGSTKTATLTFGPYTLTINVSS